MNTVIDMDIDIDVDRSQDFSGLDTYVYVHRDSCCCKLEDLLADVPRTRALHLVKFPTALYATPVRSSLMSFNEPYMS